jgi:hypothetical protein
MPEVCDGSKLGIAEVDFYLLNLYEHEESSALLS